MDENNKDKFKGIGDQVTDAIEDAIASGDYSALGDLISATVNSALVDAGKTVQVNIQKASEEIPEWQRRQRERQRLKAESIGDVVNGANRNVRKANLRRYMARPGDTGSILQIIFGLLFAINFGGACFGALIAGEFLGAIILGMLTSACVKFVKKGKATRDTYARAEKYLRLCNGKLYVDVADLAAGIGKSEDWVRKDLKMMISKRIFPQGHLDVTGTCFILNDKTFAQYKEAEEAYERRERQEKAQPAQTKQAKKEEPVVKESELDAMVREGRECIRRVREMNDQIPGEAITAKLSKLELLLNQMFDRVKVHPEQMQRMHKLMDYYLPTTLKLVEAYKEYDQVSDPGPEILKAKEEIEKTLDTINQAFAELLNSLFQDSVWDVTTDAQVLQSMLAREGLGGGMSEAVAQSQPKTSTADISALCGELTAATISDAAEATPGAAPVMPAAPMGAEASVAAGTSAPAEAAATTDATATNPTTNGSLAGLGELPDDGKITLTGF